MEPTERKIVLVAGGTGLIGSWLVPFLVSNGYRVKVLTRNPSKGFSADSNVEFIYWSGKTDKSLVELVGRSEVLINLAGYSIASLWTERNKRMIVESRIQSTRALAQTVTNSIHPPKVLVQASAVGIYPFNTNVIQTENSPSGKGFLSDLVREWENEALVAANSSRVLLNRTGVVLASNGGLLTKTASPIRYLGGVTLGKGYNIVPWIHIFDHVRAIKFLIETPTAVGAFNITSPAINIHADLVKQIAAFYKRPMLFSIPSFWLRLLPGNMANELLLASQPVQPKRLLQLGFTWTYPTLEKALANLLGK